MKNNNTHILGMPKRKADGDDLVGPPMENGSYYYNTDSGSSTNTGSSNKTSAGEWLSGIAGIGAAIAAIFGNANTKSSYTYDIYQRSGGLSTGAWIGIVSGIMAMMLIFVIALRK